MVLEPSKHPFILKEIADKVDTSLHSRQAMTDSFTIMWWLQTGISLQELARATGTATELGSGNSPTRKSDNLATLLRANPNPEESQSSY